MKVRIIKADKDTYWYADKIGEVVEVEDVGVTISGPQSHYVLAEDDKYVIRKENAEVVEDTPDNVNQPPHYAQSGKFETIEIIEEITKGYDDGFVGMCVGNTLKYLARAPYKHDNPGEDLAKAARYLTFATDYIARKKDGTN